MPIHPPIPKPTVPPLILGLALSLRLRSTFPQIRQSATLLVQWLRASVGLQAGARDCALAINAELLADRDLIRECLRNDPPAHRRRIMATLNRVQAQNLSLSASLAAPCPEKLLKD